MTDNFGKGSYSGVGAKHVIEGQNELVAQIRQADRGAPAGFHGGHPLVRNAAGNDGLKMFEVGVDINRHAMEGNPMGYRNA